MSNHDLDWVAAQRPERSGADTQAHDRALLALLRHVTAHPSRSCGGGLSLRAFRTRAFGLTATVGLAAIVTAVVLSAQGGGAQLRQGGTPAVHAAVTQHGSRSSLLRLADHVGAAALPPGDATLVQRTTHTGGQNVTVYDLYADNGKYYFSQEEGGLSGQVSSGHNLAGGLFACEVAAAKEAAAGNVQQAAIDMANAPDPDGRNQITQATATTTAPAATAAVKLKEKLTHTPAEPGTLFDNWAWENSQDAIIAGAGDPQVRAGVLQILATLPGVTVTHGTSSDGQPTLVLTGGAYEVGTGYQEQLTVNADTGMPIEFVGGAPNGPPATQVDYQVARVTLSSVATGQLPTL